MREIKFRVWNKHSKDWLILGATGIDCVTGHLVDYEYEGVKLRHQEWYIIEQYTGLKDKNGKEIYEGDILRVFFECDMFITYYKVIYDEQRAGFVAKSLSGKDDHFAGYFAKYLVNHCEVFDNIHENPELLKGNK